MRTGTDTRSRAVLVSSAVVTALAVGGAAVLAALRSPPVVDPSSPEGVTQAYFTAVFDHDEGEALALLSPELRERCSGDGPWRDLSYLEDSARVVLASVEMTAGRAVVVVEVEQIPGDSPFDLNGFSTRQRLVLTETDAGWVISDVPWPLFCPEGR